VHVILIAASFVQFIVAQMSGRFMKLIYTRLLWCTKMNIMSSE